MRRRPGAFRVWLCHRPGRESSHTTEYAPARNPADFAPSIKNPSGREATSLNSPTIRRFVIDPACLRLPLVMDSTQGCLAVNQNQRKRSYKSVSAEQPHLIRYAEYSVYRRKALSSLVPCHECRDRVLAFWKCLTGQHMPRSQ